MSFGSSQSIRSVTSQIMAIKSAYRRQCRFDFLLDNWQNDPDSITYKFVSNDGSDLLHSPLVKNGVSRYPFLIFNNDSTCTIESITINPHVALQTLLMGQINSS